MIRSLQEICERFDKIKDHKPKASKKLNELGDILASAYKMDAELADEMWQYLVDLNVRDNTANAKFYIAQVFNKLTDRLPPEEATELLALTPERVELMILHGYEGATIWHCLSTLIKGFLKMESVDNCRVIVELFAEKLGAIQQSGEQLFSAASSSLRYAHELVTEEKRYEDIVLDFFQEIRSINNARIKAYVDIKLVTFGYETSADFLALIVLARELRFPDEFAELLWLSNGRVLTEEITRQWETYLREIDGEHPRIPRPNLSSIDEMSRGDSSRNIERDGNARVKFFLSIMQNNDNILPFYFNYADDLVDHLIYTWIVEADWNRFVRYVSQILLNTQEERYEFSHIKRILDEHLEGYFRDENHTYTDIHGRSNKIITRSNITEFTSALAQISVATIGAPFHDEYHADIRAFIQKANGNLAVLEAVGFTDKTEDRSFEEQLRDHIYSFMQSGQTIHNSESSEYRRLCKAIRDEDYQAWHRDKTINHPLERSYLHATDNVIAQFYFLHCKLDADEKANMIESCIKKGNIARAVDLVELMIKTSNYDDFADHMSWAFTMQHVAGMLAAQYARREDTFWYHDEITEEERHTVIQLIERIIPYLLPDDAASIRADLIKIDPKKADSDQYVKMLMQDVAAYTMFPKPRGKGTAMSINGMSSRIHKSFEVLSSLGRLDVISQIMTRFEAVKDVLAPVAFSSWMFTLIDDLSAKDLSKLYAMNKTLFASWLETHPRELDVGRAAEKIGSCCSHAEFLEFCDMVKSRHGYVPGLTSYFQFTSENTETQLMYDGDTVQLYLDYVEAPYRMPTKEIHLLSIGKSRAARSIRVIKCEVNGETVDVQQMWQRFDDGGPEIGFFIEKCNEQEENSLSVHVDIDTLQADRGVELNTVLLQFSVFGLHGKEIETFSEILIQRNVESGLYQVVQQGSHIKTEIVLPDTETGTRVVVNKGVVQRLYSENDVDLEEDTRTNAELKFEDIALCDTDDVQIDFCGLVQSGDKLLLKFWIDNDRDEEINVFTASVEINGVYRGCTEFVAALEAHEYDFIFYDISADFDECYDNIHSIELALEVDNGAYDALLETPQLHITCNALEGSFCASLSEEHDDVEPLLLSEPELAKLQEELRKAFTTRNYITDHKRRR